MSSQQRYIGVSGFVSRAEVVSALDAFPDCRRQLMVGVLASEKGALQRKVDSVVAVLRMLEAPELANLTTVRVVVEALRKALELPAPPPPVTEGL